MANEKQEELLADDEAIKNALDKVEAEIEAAKGKPALLQQLYLKREKLQEAEYKRSVARRNKAAQK